MRIVSLLPSATEIVCGLDLRDQLVGVTHRCDYPPETGGVAVITRPLATAGGVASAASSAALAVDDMGPFELDVEAFLECRPDLVLVRDGAGPGMDQLRQALNDLADARPEVVSLDPVSIEGIFHSVTTIGAMAEAEDEALGLLEVLREDLSDLEQQLVVRRDEGIRAGRVVVLEGFDPPVSCGRWVPEQVRRAGGWEVLGREGEPAAVTTWEAIRDVDPEMLIVAPAGIHLPAAKRAWQRLEKPEFWTDLEAVRRGHVFVVEPVYFSRPGPRVVDGVGMLAEIFDPDGFVETSPVASWTPLVG
jgi:iron complex transport system substrate-binding protein